MSLASSSQTVTKQLDKKDSIVVIPATVAKQIAKDLVAFDATKLELNKTKELVLNLENQVSTQAAIIKQYEIKDGQWKQMVANYEAQVLAYKNMTNELQKDLRKSKVRGFYNKFGLTLGLATMTYLYISK
jgi:predicted component of type VI protein secretion system